MARLLAPQVVSPGQHLFDDITVSDFGAQQFYPEISQRKLQAKVTHNRGHNGFLLEGSFFSHVFCAHSQDLIAIQYFAGFIDEHRAIRVAVEGHRKIRMFLQQNVSGGLRIKSAALPVDIFPVGLNTEWNYLGSQLRQNLRHNPIGSTVAAISYNAQPLQREMTWKTIF